MGNLVITIARGYGSGGKSMGMLLAKEMGFLFMTENFSDLLLMTVVSMNPYLEKLMKH